MRARKLPSCLTPPSCCFFFLADLASFDLALLSWRDLKGGSQTWWTWVGVCRRGTEGRWSTPLCTWDWTEQQRSLGAPGVQGMGGRATHLAELTVARVRPGK